MVIRWTQDLRPRFADEQVQTTVVGVSPRFLESPDTSRR